MRHNPVTFVDEDGKEKILTYDDILVIDPEYPQRQIEAKNNNCFYSMESFIDDDGKTWYNYGSIRLNSLYKQAGII